MRELLKENMGTMETGFRFLLGTLLLALAMFGIETAAWVALLAIYPVITAIMAWDPVYAIIHWATWRIKTTPMHKPSALPAS